MTLGFASGTSAQAVAGRPDSPEEAAVVEDAAMAIPISTCRFSITAPGTYDLVSDLSCNGFTGIQIANTHDVRLRLNGHTIDTGGTSAVGVHRSTRVKIFGPGTMLRGGVAMSWTTDSMVRDLDIRDCLSASLRLAGITLYDSNENMILGNRIDHCYFGIGMQDSNGNKVIGNQATENKWSGFQGARCDRNVIINNVFNQNDVGLTLYAGSNGNHVSSNTTDRNTRGILVYGVTDTENIFTGNSAHDNVGLDVADYSRCANRWRGNSFATDSEGDGPAAGCIQ